LIRTSRVPTRRLVRRARRNTPGLRKFSIRQGKQIMFSGPLLAEAFGDPVVQAYEAASTLEE